MSRRPHASLSCALLIGLMAPASLADTLTWDHDANGSASDGGGTWLNANQWVNGGSDTWDNGVPDDAVIGSGGSGGTIDLGTGVTANNVDFNNFSGQYTLANGVLTVNGTMTLGSTSGNVHFSNAAGTGFAGSGNVVINGIYPTVKSGPTQLSFWQLNETENNFTGTYTVNNGILFTQGGDRNGGGQGIDAGATIILSGNAGAGNGAVFSSRWGGNMNRDLGTGAGQIQVTGNRSGFEGQGTTGLTVWLNNSSTTPIVWGSANFDPNVLILQSENANENANVNFRNSLDLNGANRTVAVDKDHANDIATGFYNNDGRGQISGVISNSGATAGLIKEGVGQLVLAAANTYDGATTVNEGTLQLAHNGSVASSSGVTMADGTELSVRVGGGSNYSGAASGAGSLGNLLSKTTFGSNTTLTLRGSVDYAGSISSGVGHVWLRDGNITLSGDNSGYAGSIRVGRRGGSARTLTLGSNNALSGGGDLIVDSSGSSSVNLNGFNATIGKLTTGSNSGGSRGIVTGTGTLTITDGVYSDDHNNGGGGIFVTTLDLNGTNQVFEVRDSGSFTVTQGDFLITSVIQNGSLTMTGLENNASLRLEGINTYTGNTTVTNGILSINNAFLADSSEVFLETGGRMDLDFIGTDVVSELWLAGVAQGAGVYDATSHSSFFTGTGSITVVIPEPSVALLGMFSGLLLLRRRRLA